MLFEVYKCVQLNRCYLVCLAEGVEGIGQMWVSEAVSELGRGKVRRVGLVNSCI